MCKPSAPPPDRQKPAQWIMYDLWQRMRVCDTSKANAIITPLDTFMEAQTAKERLGMHDDISRYLEYRQADVGQQ